MLPPAFDETAHVQNVDRLRAPLAGSTPARPVVFPMVVADHAARLAGVPVRKAATDATTLARVLFHAWEYYGYDLVMVFADTVVEAEAMGALVEFPEDDNAFLVEPPAEGGLAPADPERDGRLPMMLAATRMLKERLGNRVQLVTSIKGTFTLASFLAGMERFLNAVLSDPDTARRYLDLAHANQVRYVAAVVRAGGIPFIGDPVASGSLVSPQVFHDFARPYLTRLVAEIHACGCWAGLHICGDTQGIVTDMAATGADVLSVDDIDLAAARRSLGPNVILMGNVSTRLVESGTSAETGAAARRCIADAGSRLILSTACDVSAGSPPGNVRAIVEAART